jgi:hypothetical protein
MKNISYILFGIIIWILSLQGLTYLDELKAPIQILPENVQPPAPPKPTLKPQSTDPELFDVQVPIPKEMRVYNHSGSQCVWCTIEMLAKFNNIPGAKDLTNSYKYATGPREVKRVLESRGVKFKQTYDRNEDMLEEYVTKRNLGVGVDVNNGHHMILVCHFDKKAGIVKIIDNSDHSLKVQTWSLSHFRNKWSDWILVILPPTEQNVAQPEGNSKEWLDWWNSKR